MHCDLCTFIFTITFIVCFTVSTSSSWVRTFLHHQPPHTHIVIYVCLFSWSLSLCTSKWVKLRQQGTSSKCGAGLIARPYFVGQMASHHRAFYHTLNMCSKKVLKTSSLIPTKWWTEKSLQDPTLTIILQTLSWLESFP